MAIAGNILFVFAILAVAEPAIAGNDFGGKSTAVAIAPKLSAAEITSNTPSSKTVKEKSARSLVLPGLDGVTHSLEEWKGKVVVLNFWATWCSPCLYEIRDFVAYQEQYKARGLQIIGVGIDEEKKLRNVQRTLEINYPVLIADPKNNNDPLIKSWGNTGGTVPYSVVIDRDGRVVYTLHGLLSHETFDENILPLLDKI